MSTAYKRQIKHFARVSLAEGVSFLVLLLIAMPLKYIYEMPLMVKYFGWAHGILFIWYISLLLMLTINLKWSFKRLVVFFIAAFLPLAPFFVERKVQKEYL